MNEMKLSLLFNKELDKLIRKETIDEIKIKDEECKDMLSIAKLIAKIDRSCESVNRQVLKAKLLSQIKAKISEEGKLSENELIDEDELTYEELDIASAAGNIPIIKQNITEDDQKKF